MTRNIIVATLFFFSTAVAGAQSPVIEKLESQAFGSQLDTTKVLLLNELAGLLRETDLNKAKKYAEEALQLAQQLDYQRGLGAAMENLGWINYRKGDYTESLKLSTRALEINRVAGDPQMEARCLNNIAAIHHHQGNYDQAIQTFRNALEIGEALGDTRLVARCLNNIAFSFQSSGRMDSVSAYVDRAFAAAEAAKDKYMKGFALRIKGDVYLSKGALASAREMFVKCLAIADEINNNFLRVTTLYRLGEVHLSLDQPDLALGYLERNETIAKDYGYQFELERSYKIMSEAYFQKNDMEKAFGAQQRYIQIHDSLYSERSSEQLNLMQAKYDSEIKQAQIELLTKDTQIKQNELDTQKTWFYFTIGCLSLISMLTFVLFYSYARIKRVNRKLEEKNHEVNKQTQQLTNLNLTKDKLFSIISHDLRSPVASLKGLVDIFNTQNLSQEDFIKVTHKLKRNLDSVYDDLDNLLQWSKSQMNGLQANPEKFDLHELAEEKVRLFREIADHKSVKIINNIPGNAMVMADRNHMELVLRNLLANAIKFNDVGGTVELLCVRTHGEFEISVSDSGVGISFDDLNKLFNAETHFTKRGTNEEKGAGIGLLITKEFVEINGGSIWVTSELGKGSTFTFTVCRDPQFADTKPELVAP